LPRIRDVYLSCTLGRSPDATVYDMLWPTRSALARLAERRHRDLLASRDPEAHKLGQQLQQQRDRLTRLFWSPLADPVPHRQEAENLTTAKEDLEKRLAQRLRLHAPPAAADVLPRPDDLRARLPAGAAFVDCFRYTVIDQGLDGHRSRGLRRAAHYVV